MSPFDPTFGGFRFGTRPGWAEPVWCLWSDQFGLEGSDLGLGKHVAVVGYGRDLRIDTGLGEPAGDGRRCPVSTAWVGARTRHATSWSPSQAPDRRVESVEETDVHPLGRPPSDDWLRFALLCGALGA